LAGHAGTVAEGAGGNRVDYGLVGPLRATAQAARVVKDISARRALSRWSTASQTFLVATQARAIR
jgi:hypothetical protein